MAVKTFTLSIDGRKFEVEAEGRNLLPSEPEASDPNGTDPNETERVHG